MRRERILDFPERVAEIERALERKGCVYLPASLWPGATAEAYEDALANFEEVVAHFALEVEQVDDGGYIAFPPFTDEAEKQRLKARAEAADTN
jgi:hypothetical protein